MEIGGSGVVKSLILRTILGSVSCGAIATGAVASPVTYEGYLVTDITFAGRPYHNAEVTIVFKGDTRDVQTLLAFPVQPDPTNTQNGGGAFIDRGVASVRILAGGHRINARLLPNQLVVAWDSYNGGIGFGARIGPHGFEPAYPLGLSNGTIGYPTDPVAALSTPGTTSGNAWSCIGFPPSDNNYTCSDPRPYPLKTDAGDLVLFNPYLYHNATGGMSNFSGTLNRGIFTIVPTVAGE